MEARVDMDVKTPALAALLLSMIAVTGCNSSDPAEAGAIASAPPQRSAVERSTLRETAIEELEEAAFSEFAILRANGLEGLQPARSRAEPIARAALVDENIGVRFTGAMTVGKLRLRQSAELARPLLDDPDVSVRIAAIFALAANNVDVDQSPLGDALLDGTPRARLHAAFVLGELGNESAIPLLREASRRAQVGSGMPLPPAQQRLLRLQIAEALVKLGETNAGDTLRAALYPSAIEELEASVMAAQSLGEVGDESAVAELIQLLEARRMDSDEPLYPVELRLAAATAVAKLGYPDGSYVGWDVEADESEVIRAQVAFLYGATGGPDDVTRLERMLREDESPLVRVAAAASILQALES